MRQNYRSGLLFITALFTLPLLYNCASLSPDYDPEFDQMLLEDQLQHDDNRTNQQKLASIDTFIARQKYKNAAIVLNTLSFNELNIAEKTRYALAKVDIALALQQGQEALSWLTGNQSYLFDGLDFDQQITIRLKKAQAFELSGQMFAAARERIYLDPVLTGTQKTDNMHALWQALARVPSVSLQRSLMSESSPDILGWIELSLISRGRNGDLYELKDQIARWQFDNPQHPASQILPTSLLSLDKISEEHADHVGILLPLTGPLAEAGKAIRNGLLSAWHQGSLGEFDRPKLNFYDTNTSPNVQTLYQTAVETGAQVIIGPLAKENVKQLSLQAPFEVPIIALNYIDQTSQSSFSPPFFYQFGLAPEDEVKQIAQDIWFQGVRNVLIIAPEGQWGTRVRETFIQYWNNQGGTIADTVILTEPEQYLKALQRAFYIDASNQRHRQLERLFGESLEFEFRTRQDIDRVLLLAFPDQARQVKPLLAYQRAGDIPIIATSSIYSGTPNPDKDKDLNQIEIVEMPWRLYPSDLQNRAKQAFPQSTKRYGNLVALGADAYRLYLRLPQLSAYDGAHIQGETGLLSLTEQGRIERILDWAIFKDGLLTPKIHTFSTQKSTQRQAKMQGTY